MQVGFLMMIKHTLGLATLALVLFLVKMVSVFELAVLKSLDLRIYWMKPKLAVKQHLLNVVCHCSLFGFDETHWLSLGCIC